MKESYGFQVDVDVFNDVDNVRIFDVKADEKQVEQFIKDLGLFEEKEEDGE